MFLTNWLLEEGNKEKKKIASMKQFWENEYPNNYVYNRACASNILADIKSYTPLASKIYQMAHGTTDRDAMALINPEIKSWHGTVNEPLFLVSYLNALTQGKYDGTSIQKLVTAAKEPDTFDYDGEYLTFDAIIDALTIAQDISLISFYIAEPLNLNYRQKQLDLPNPDFVRVFINNGGNEFVEALYNGCAVEDIVSQ